MVRVVCTVTTTLVYDQRMQRICTTLHKNGYAVLLVGRDLPGSPVYSAPYSHKRLKCLFEKGFAFYAEYNVRLFLLLAFYGKAIVNSVDMDTLPAARLACLLTGNPLVFDAHEYFSQVPEVVGRSRVQGFWQWLENNLIPGLKYAYTVSQTLAQRFTKLYQVPFALVRNMPFQVESMHENTITPPVDAPYLIYIGAVNMGRGVDVLIKAVCKLECKLLVCGEGDMLGEMKHLAVTLGLNHKVVFTGYVTPQLLKQYTAGALAGTLLLENRGQSYYYSLANKFFDYVQAGIPQLCVPFPEYEVLNNRYEVALLTNYTVEAVIANAQRLLQDETLRQRLAFNAAKAAQEWNWQQEEQTLLQIYARAAQQLAAKP